MAPRRQPPQPTRPPTKTIPLTGGSVALTRPNPALIPPPKAPVDPKVQADQEAQQAEETRKEDIVKECVERLAIAAEAMGPQIARELDDLAFELDQWPAEYREQRAGGVDKATGRTLPSRPTLEINKIDQPIQQVLNEARMGRLSIQIKPKGNGASQETAEVRQGLIRSIEVDSRAHMVRMWALDRAVKCGRGCYRINKAYANDGDFEMDLVVERILNQHAVYLDPYAKEPDWSDMLWAIVTSDLPESEFERRWPEAELSNASEAKLTSLADQRPGWITQEKDKRAFRIAEYFWVEFTDRVLVFHPRWETPKFEDALDEIDRMLITADRQMVKKRTVPKRTVHHCVLNALEILEEDVWEGRYIPIVAVVGKEYNVKGVRSWKGVIANAKDAQRSYNVMRSKQLEAIGLSTLAQWVLAEGQHEGYEEMWNASNYRAFPYLVYKPTTYGEHLLPPPHRDVTEPAIAAITQAVREADNDIKSTTGRFDPSLGRQQTQQSGRAIRELKVQGETGTSNYLDNLANLSMVYEGRVLNDMLEHVYDTPGRVVRILDDEDAEREIMLNQPYVMGRDKTMQAVQGDMVVGKDKLKHYNLKDGGQYRVVVSVGKSFPTMRDEDKDFLADLAQAWPQGVAIFADLWVASHDSKAARTVSKRIKDNNPYAKSDGEDEGGAMPPEAQAQIKQAQQQVQQLQQQLQQLGEEVKSQRAKAQADLTGRREELVLRERIERAKIEADLRKKHAELAGDRGLKLLEAEIERESQGRRQRHERELAREARILDTAVEQPMEE